LKTCRYSPGCHTTCIAAGVAIYGRLSGCHTTAATEHPQSMRPGMEPEAGVALLIYAPDSSFVNSDRLYKLCACVKIIVSPISHATYGVRSPRLTRQSLTKLSLQLCHTTASTEKSRSVPPAWSQHGRCRKS
jgi:hypothetical protein